MRICSGKGFRLCGLDGRSGTLAHVDLRTGYRVGKYGVDVDGFEAFLERLPFSTLRTGLVMIDEIGKMECFSKLFKKTLEGVLDSNRPVIGSIAMKGDRFIQKIKERSDVLLVTVTPQNRDELVNMYLKFDR